MAICKIKISGPILMSVESEQRDVLSRKVNVNFLGLPTISLNRCTRIRASSPSPSPSWSKDSWKSKEGHGFKESKQLEAAVNFFEPLVTPVIPSQILTLEYELGQAAVGRGFVTLDGDFDDLNPMDSIENHIILTSDIAFTRGYPNIKIARVLELGKPIPDEKDYPLRMQLPRLCDGDSDLPVRMGLAYLQTTQSWNCANHVSYLDDRKTVWRSHKCSMLPYEQALTKEHQISGLYYCCSAHMLWIREDFTDAHVEFLRGISNPIGIEITDASKLSPDHLTKLIALLNPDNRPGRITVLTNFKSHLIKPELSSFIQAVNRAHQIVTWLIHPAADSLLDDIQAFTRVLDREGSYLGGLELSTRNWPENEGNYCESGLHMEAAIEYAMSQ